MRGSMRHVVQGGLGAVVAAHRGQLLQVPHHLPPPGCAVGRGPPRCRAPAARRPWLVGMLGAACACRATKQTQLLHRARPRSGGRRCTRAPGTGRRPGRRWSVRRRSAWAGDESGLLGVPHHDLHVDAQVLAVFDDRGLESLIDPGLGDGGDVGGDLVQQGALPMAFSCTLSATITTAMISPITSTASPRLRPGTFLFASDGCAAIPCEAAGPDSRPGRRLRGVQSMTYAMPARYRCSIEAGPARQFLQGVFSCCGRVLPVVATRCGCVVRQ